MTVLTKYWSELSLDELYAILQLRCGVFMLEQRIICQDMDEVDKISYHIFVNDDGGRMLAYLRVFETGGEVHVGRVLTAGCVRGKGLGRVIVERALSVAEENFSGLPIVLHSQEQVVGFYEKLGFEVCSQRFMEEGVPHFKMKYNKNK